MRYIDADKLIELANKTKDKTIDANDIARFPTADVVEVGKWCDMHEYILEMQADENGHNEFFRIIKLPVIFIDDEVQEIQER